MWWNLRGVISGAVSVLIADLHSIGAHQGTVGGKD
jgi:hypothetical protein